MNGFVIDLTHEANDDVVVIVAPPQQNDVVVVVAAPPQQNDVVVVAAPPQQNDVVVVVAPLPMAAVPPQAEANAVNFVVTGKPVPYKRVAKAARHNRMYDPRKHQKEAFVEACRDHLPVEPMDGALRLKVDFKFKRPKSHYRYRKGQERQLKPDAKMFPRADVDNLAKFVMDALNKEAYDDDKQIIKLCSSKSFLPEGSADEEHTAVTLTTV